MNYHFSYEIVMIWNFLFLKVPVNCSKRFENSPASVKSKILFITPAKMRFPVQKEHSPSFTARQHNGPRLLQKPGVVAWPSKLNSPANVIAKEALSYR